MEFIHALFAAAICATATISQAQSFRVVGVTDGDSLIVLAPNRSSIKCRLHGIDAPERNQAFGQVAKSALSALTYNRRVDIQLMGRDRYKRAICKVTVAGLDVNREMIATGMAWMYRRYTSDPEYAAAENVARAKRLGVWSDPHPVAPWHYRQRGKR